jgi:hypothetical protein
MTTIIDGSAGITFPNSTTQASSSKVLQVVNASYSTITSSTTNAWANTGITASITPLFSTSKILVSAYVQGCTKSATGTQVALRINRNSTTIITFSTNGGDNTSNIGMDIGTIATEYLDSPATTSSTTYTVQLANDNNTGTVYINNNYFLGAVTSTITLMEIAQ